MYVDLFIAQLTGAMVGKAVSVTFFGLLFSFLYPIFSLTKLKTAVVAGLVVTVVTGIAVGWAMAYGQAYNMASDGLRMDGRDIDKLTELEKKFVEGYMEGTTRKLRWYNWWHLIPLMLPVSVMLSAFGWSIRRILRGR